MDPSGEIGVRAEPDARAEPSGAPPAPAVAEVRSWWRALVEHSPDVVAVLGADLTLLYASPALERVLGYRPDQVVGRRGSLLDRGDEARIVAQARELVRAPARTVTTTARFLHRDGTTRELDLTVTNLLHEPSVRGIVLHARDVTEHRGLQRALNAGEERLRAIVDDQSELVCRYLPDLTITFVNRAFVEFFGGTPDAWIGESLTRVMWPEDVEGERARLRTFAPGEVRVQSVWERRHDGAMRWFEWTDRALGDDDRGIVEFQAVGREVHEQFLAEAMLATQARVLELVAHRRPIDEALGALVTTACEVQPHSRAMIHLSDGAGLRCVAEAKLEGSWAATVGTIDPAHGPDPVMLATSAAGPIAVDDVAADPRWRGHAEALRAAGITRTLCLPLERAGGDVVGVLTILDTRDRPLVDADRRFVDALARLAEIAIERRAFEDQLAHSSLHDPLTGLPNRSLLLDRLDQALARAERDRRGVAVLFLDLDGFKVYNDSLGHAAGDRLLVATARRLEAALRPGDTVARFGGDEFVILCADLPAAAAAREATAIAGRLLDALAEPFRVDGTDAYLLASIGIAAASGPARPEDLLRDADSAMYHAKEQGRGRSAVFDDAMRVEAQARHATISALHGAVGRGEVAVHYQPIVAADSGRLVAAEALVRWRHPDRGLLSPDEFLPLAETSDLIVEVGHEVLRRACAQATRWHVHGAPLGVSVNLAARQLAHPDFPAALAGVLGECGLDPARLCLEITESALLRDADHSSEAIARLKALGVRFAIDDFGTGYSSLTYLQRFPVDVVKIDRTFVAGLGLPGTDSASTSASAIVGAVVGLARALGLQVVAEGVETEEQLARLRALGCDHAQGFLVAEPMPAADFDTWRTARGR